ncbi:MAG: hypothetical protein CMJ78_05075 [Planctomycetaceae bacterium]|nr:hypothetical protein [Planctomycetaceae bacterium]
MIDMESMMFGIQLTQSELVVISCFGMLGFSLLCLHLGWLLRQSRHAPRIHQSKLSLDNSPEPSKRSDSGKAISA